MRPSKKTLFALGIAGTSIFLASFYSAKHWDRSLVGAWSNPNHSFIFTKDHRFDYFSSSWHSEGSWREWGDNRRFRLIWDGGFESAAWYSRDSRDLKIVFGDYVVNLWKKWLSFGL